MSEDTPESETPRCARYSRASWSGSSASSASIRADTATASVPRWVFANSRTARPCGDVDDVLVLEAAHDLDDRVDLADVLEELVAEPLALGRALDEAGDVHELDRRRDDALGLRELRERLEPGVGDRDDADVRLDRA